MYPPNFKLKEARSLGKKITLVLDIISIQTKQEGVAWSKAKKSKDNILKVDNKVGANAKQKPSINSATSSQILKTELMSIANPKSNKAY